MSVFVRRFGFDPGAEVLLEIESVNVLDLDPPATISGIGTGTVICVGEFENGPFAATDGVAELPKGVYEVSGASDFVASSGMLGYAYDGIPSNNPCARKRSADGGVAEAWNGNGFVQLSGKKFRRLLLARVDTSVGSVQFRRQAFLTGGSDFSFNLEPAQTLVVVDQGTTRTATFNATAATVTSGAGTYPTTFAGGETLTLGFDDAPNFTVTFLDADETRDQIVARINLAAGFTFVAGVSTTQISLTGIKRGNTANVRIVSGSAGVLTKFNMVAATTFGTGNVGNIDAVSFQEVEAVVEAAMTAGSIKVDRDPSNRLRVSKAYSSTDDWLTLSATSTATGLGFVANEHASNSGFAYVRSTAGTFPTSFAGGETLVIANDDSPDTTVIFLAGDTTQALIIARINATMGYACATSISATVTQFRGNANGGRMAIVSASAGVFTALGLSAQSVTATTLSSGKIPAGTVVQNVGATNKFVTMQDTYVAVAAIAGVSASGTGPYPVKVRHATDDGTGTSANAGTLVSLERQPDVGSFDVSNPANVSAALSEAAIDAAYATAIDATGDINTVAREANMTFSARQSNAVRSKMRSNAISASGAGSRGRMACIRPPLNTTKAAAMSGFAAPGVGVTRDQRVIYCYPGANTFVPAIATRGLAGGYGFTATGNVDVGADGFMASVCSQLPPEENPGQETAFTAEINGVESGANAQGFQIGDYTQFRAKGIAALRMAGSVAVFQSGVTSVDPSRYPQLRNIARRRMADFVQDSIAESSTKFGKKLNTFTRRVALANEIQQFLEVLLSKNQPTRQRIAGYTIDAKSGNTPESIGAGMYRIIVKVRTLSSMDSIVLETTIGEQVVVNEQLPEAA